MNRRGAYTYLEVAIVAVVVVIMFMAALPDGDTAANQEGLELAHRFEADVAYARSLSIARPDDPAIIKVDGANNRYWLAQASAPDTPILHPWTKQPYLVQSGPGGDPGLEHVYIVGLDFGGDAIIGFDSTGSTDQDTVAVLQVQSGDSGYQVSVDPVSGGSSSQMGFGSNVGSSPTGFTF